MRACAAATLVVTACVAHVTAVDIPFRRVRGTTSGRPSRAAAAVLDATDPFGFMNLNNNVYVADIFVQGVNFTVCMFSLIDLYES